jgi:hypothetical protein
MEPHASTPEPLVSPLWFQIARRRERPVMQAAALILTNVEPSRLAIQAFPNTLATRP